MQQDYGMRVYDNRLGKFLSVDPLTKSFPMLTPYQFASNSPVANIDLDGEEAKYFNIEITEIFNGKGVLVHQDTRQIEDKSKEAGWFVHSGIYKSPGNLGSGTLFTFTKATHKPKADGTMEILIEDNGALYIPAAEDKGRGGFYFTSSNGGSFRGSGSLSEGDGTPINIDLLVSAVGGFPSGNADTEMSPFQYSGDEVNKIRKLAEILKSDKGFADKVDKLMEGVKAILNTENAGEKIGEAVNKVIEDKAKKNGEAFLQCKSCGAYKIVGGKKVMHPHKKDTVDQGITPKNTKKASFEKFHDD